MAWQSSLLAGKTDVNAGTFECSAIDTMGYEAVALGIYVSSPVAAELRFSADVMFHSYLRSSNGREAERLHTRQATIREPVAESTEKRMSLDEARDSALYRYFDDGFNA